MLSLLPLGGCAEFLHPTVKYQTVAASTRHDTATAKEYNAEAMVLLDGSPTAHQLTKIEKLLNDALVADVTYGPAHNTLGTLYFMQNKLYLAAWEFEYAAKLMPDLAQPYNNLGLVHERVGKYEDAISYYSMALSRDSQNAQVVGNLVRARMLTGDRSPELKDMISDLALVHADPAWQSWARDQVELTQFEKGDSKLTNDWRVPEEASEALPEPIRDEDVQPNPLRPEEASPQLLPAISPGADISFTE